MRIRALLYSNSMPLTVNLCLLVPSALLLFLCSITSCLGGPYQDCYSNTFPCGRFHFRYPFGENGRGCGDPDLQLDCNDQSGYPLLNISGNEYRIIERVDWEINYSPKSMTIVNNNLFGNKCSLSGNYSQFWSSVSDFHVTDVYRSLTLWKSCSQITDPFDGSFNSCGDQWYYSYHPPLNWKTPSCIAFQFPILNPPTPDDPYPIKTLREKGFEVTWHVDPKREEICDACFKSNGSCGYDSSNPTKFQCICPDNRRTAHKCSSNGGRKKSIIIGCSIGGAALVAIAAVLFLRFYAKRRKTLSRGLASGDMETAMLPRREIGNLPIFSYEELRQATNCFHEENELGDGGFGSVYLGKLKDGRTVAVKRLYQDNSRRLEQFINEVQIFSTLNHPRVVRLYGCTSEDSPELLLVYEFVSNGTLADHLHGDRRSPRGLTWDARLNIAIQTAEALAFLHSIDPPIFHRDVKSSNILLDEYFNVKVADFGLCRIVPVNASHVTTAPQGTPGYVDPEYHQCYQLTEKSDVYSFGVVLMEIISAKLAVDINRNRNEIGLANMAKSKIQEGALHELVDPQLEIEANHELKVTVSAVAELALRCLASERDGRPHMTEVAVQLREIKQSWDTSTDASERDGRPHMTEVAVQLREIKQSWDTSTDAGEQQWGSFSNSKEPLSPISVQDKWERG